MVVGHRIQFGIVEIRREPSIVTGRPARGQLEIGVSRFELAENPLFRGGKPRINLELLLGSPQFAVSVSHVAVDFFQPPPGLQNEPDELPITTQCRLIIRAKTGIASVP